MRLHTDSNIEIVCSNMWQWQEHKKPQKKSAKNTSVTQKGHAKNCWCFVSLVFLNWKFNLQKTLCVGYYCNEV